MLNGNRVTAMALDNVGKNSDAFVLDIIEIIEDMKRCGRRIRSPFHNSRAPNSIRLFPPYLRLPLRSTVSE